MCSKTWRPNHRPGSEHVGVSCLCGVGYVGHSATPGQCNAEDTTVSVPTSQNLPQIPLLPLWP